MKYSVPTNWDDKLIHNLKEISRGYELEIYGKLREDFLGGGRPSAILGPVSAKKAAAHIRYIHDCGFKFNYLLNTACLDNLEYTRRGQAQISKILDWLSALKVESVTVTIPFLLQLIKKQYPHFKVTVSTMAHVNSCLKAQRWQELGADKITLSNTESNRNFRLFKALKKSLSCEIQLISNANCLYCCPFHFYHANLSSHSSQAHHSSKGFVIDSCYLNCRLQHLMHPEDFIRSTWIRPEDTAYYEEAGIDSLKFIDRGMTSAALTRITKAYLDRHYAGNLFDLFMTPANSANFNKMDLWSRFKYFFRPGSINIFKLMKGMRLAADWGVFIDNRALDGFIQHFLEHHCEDTTCEECRYCHNVSMRAVKIERRKEVFEQYRSYQESLTSGDIFKYL